MADDAGSLPFAEQSEFFRRKLNLPTESWTDIYTQEHDWAFVVAGANRDAIVADFRAAVQKAIDDGTTLEDFRKDFDTIVAKYGWDYNGGRNWRSRVIYDTNLSSSYQSGRYQQLQAEKLLRPFWQYVHSDWVQDPRPQHLAWNGLVLSADDLWWRRHFPPNGWGCQCRVFSLSQRDLEQLGKTGPDAAPETTLVRQTIGQRSPNGPREVEVPDGIDPGFEYTPGRARLESAIPPERPNPLVPGSAGGPGLPNARPATPLPSPRPFPAEQLLPENRPPADYAAAFLNAFGATLDTPAVVEDVMGERLVVGRQLFTDADGNLKADKRGRGPYMPLLAETLLHPDEIWVRLEWIYALQRAVVRRRYVAQFVVEGEDAPALVVFETGADGWAGVTAFQGAQQSAEDWRVGVRLYRRDDEDGGNE